MVHRNTAENGEASPSTMYMAHPAALVGLAGALDAELDGTMTCDELRRRTCAGLSLRTTTITYLWILLKGVNTQAAHGLERSICDMHASLFYTYARMHDHAHAHTITLTHTQPLICFSMSGIDMQRDTFIDVRHPDATEHRTLPQLNLAGRGHIINDPNRHNGHEVEENIPPKGHVIQGRGGVGGQDERRHANNDALVEECRPNVGRRSRVFTKGVNIRDG